jgi:hypothetical protein
MSIRSRFSDAVANWFHGTYLPHDNPPDSGVFIVGGYQDRHWTAKIVGAIGRFIATEWKWIIGILIAISGVAVAALKLYQ